MLKHLPALIIVLLLAGCAWQDEEEVYPRKDNLNPPDTVTYERHMKPLFTGNCTTIGCHDAFASGGVRLDEYAPAREAAASGKLIAAVTNPDPARRMPPGGQLEPQQIELMKKWISDGLKEK